MKISTKYGKFFVQKYIIYYLGEQLIIDIALSVFWKHRYNYIGFTGADLNITKLYDYNISVDINHACTM